MRTCHACPLLRHSVLLHESWPVTGVPPRVGNAVVRRYGDEGVVGCAAGAAVLGLAARRVDALDAELYELELVVVSLAAQSNDRVQWHLHVRKLLRGAVHEEADDAAEHRLVGNHQNVRRLLEVDDHWLDPLHSVHVALAPWVAVA